MGGVLMVAGIAMLWPSWYALGWVFLYAVLGHTKVLTERNILEKFSVKNIRGIADGPTAMWAFPNADRFINRPRLRPS
jgi:hypothetical protein